MSLWNPLILPNILRIFIKLNREDYCFIKKIKLSIPGMDSLLGYLYSEKISEESVILFPMAEDQGEFLIKKRFGVSGKVIRLAIL